MRIASSVAERHKWMKRPIFLISFLSMKVEGSKFLTSAAILHANCVGSNWVIRATPLFPANRFCHTSAVLLPTPQIRPIPVTTTRRANYFPPFWRAETGSTRSRNSRRRSSGVFMAGSGARRRTGVYLPTLACLEM